MEDELIDYHLPEELIAQVPLDNRSASRLLMLDRVSGEIRHSKFTDCLTLFKPQDILVLNETRVTAMRLYGKRDSTGQGKVELLLISEFAPNTYRCLVSPAKKLKVGQKILLENDLIGMVLEELDSGTRLISFNIHGENIPLEQNPISLPGNDPFKIRNKLLEIGFSPLPPYIKKSLADKERYQTVYAEIESNGLGSAAAPTAGLHFTQEILKEIERKGVTLVKVNLQVGLDTFRPIAEEKIEDHKMHGEFCSITAEACDAINSRKGRLIAVGTTSVRTLETFARQCADGKGKIKPGSVHSKLFLKPGDTFNLVDGMFTNFHMPRTTMLLMIAAFSNPQHIRNAYAEAVQCRYRFLSFGDSMYIGQLG